MLLHTIPQTEHELTTQLEHFISEVCMFGRSVFTMEQNILLLVD